MTQINNLKQFKSASVEDIKNTIKTELNKASDSIFETKLWSIVEGNKIAENELFLIGNEVKQTLKATY